MDHESLILQLEELVRSMREDPIFPWRIGTSELIAKINAACAELGLEPPILFEWNPERGLAKFGVRTFDRTVSLPPMDPLSPQTPLHGFAACANWWVPEVLAADGEVLRHSSGRAKRDLHASPLPAKDRRTCIELLMQWILKSRSERCEPHPPRFPEPTSVLSPKAAALREILQEAHPVGIQGPEIDDRMRQRGFYLDAQALKRTREELARAGCPIGNLRGVGYYLETTQ